MALVVAGQTNKAIGTRLGISHRTVEIHRSRILRKTHTASLMELARLAADCDVTKENAAPPPPPEES